MTGDKLEKLREKRDALNARIQLEVNRENAKKRKADTRRKILAGAAVLDDAEKHPKHKDQLYKLLGHFLTRPDDRALFGLEPLADGKAKHGEPPAQHQTGGENPSA